VKHVKILGLAAVAAMALMAFVGASSASATVLCNVSTSPCPAGGIYGSGQVIKGTASNAELTSTGIGFPNVICGTSKTETKIENAGGAAATVTGQVTALTFENCKTSTGIECKVEVENLPYHAEVHWTEESDGTLTVKTGGTGNPGATVICGTVISCTFSKSLFTLSVTGGNPAHVTAAQVPLELTKIGACPASATWDATYVATSPTSIWVAQQ
jgi:hypothetical protein